MKLSLFPFQEAALADLTNRIKMAKSMLASGQDKQVIISFSAPTGSGKTIVMATLFEDILFGSADFDSEPRSVFVWLSDMPMLNEQSRLKIEGKSDKIRVGDLRTIDANFDADCLEAGHIYFLNTQKLGSDKLLTQHSDARQNTIWETLTNTAKRHKGRFYLIIDEAHRGTNQSARSENVAKSIVQKFIFGSPDDGLCKMPLIIGMSATPQRFNNLVQNVNSPKFTVEIKPEDVRSSGLLKDRIILHYPEMADITPEMAMFRSAVENWKAKAAKWEKYCKSYDEPTVKPILVIQVENTIDSQITGTDLTECLSTLEECLHRPLREWEIVHCFGEKETLKIGRWVIHGKEPSRIEESEKANFVIFKMALSTGWDCPRAEVMMSFRSARDYTHITQLLGRMVRTPLARRIASDDELNDVRLFLPHYDETTVREVVEALKSGEDMLSSEATLASESVTYYKNTQFLDVFEAMESLITYAVDTARKMQPLPRLMKFGRGLAFNGIDIEVLLAIKKAIVDKMSEAITRLKLEGKYDAMSKAVTGYDLKAVIFDQTDRAYTITDAGRQQVHDLDIGRYFEIANKKLQDGLGMVYWKAKLVVDEDISDHDVMIDVIVIANSNDVMESLNRFARDEFFSLYEKFRKTIALLPEKKKNDFEALAGVSDSPIHIDWSLPESIGFTINADSREYQKHLYVSTENTFKTTLNDWESGLIKEELKKPSTYAWLRNLDRKHWSLAIPYQDGDVIRPMYPDMVVVSKIDGEFKFSILEPHDASRADNVKKVRGMAEFAEKHQGVYDRIQLIRKMTGADRKEHYYRLDMAKPEVREKVNTLTPDNDELDKLFNTMAHIEG
ncbi:MAG: DEAD/DEAH box helicase family protein [Holophagaceae bacterium]|nr:DEAD/DEAH box helicase family protein [Holophagaceae bacterium]